MCRIIVPHSDRDVIEVCEEHTSIEISVPAEHHKEAVQALWHALKPFHSLRYYRCEEAAALVEMAYNYRRSR